MENEFQFGSLERTEWTDGYFPSLTSEDPAKVPCLSVMLRGQSQGRWWQASVGYLVFLSQPKGHKPVSTYGNEQVSTFPQNTGNTSSNLVPLLLTQRTYVQKHLMMQSIKLQNDSQIMLVPEGHVCLLSNFIKYLLKVFGGGEQIDFLSFFFFKMATLRSVFQFQRYPLFSDFLNAHHWMWG